MTEVEAIEEVAEITPLDMIATLEDQLSTTMTALRRIANIDVTAIPGGPNNKNFGRKFVVGLQTAQSLAAEAYQKVEQS